MKAIALSLLVASVAHGETLSNALLNEAFSSQPAVTKLKEDELLRMTPEARYPWHTVTSTVFAAGENATEGGGIDNYKSAWDSKWLEHFGSGLGQNPWYVALPVNDVLNDHETRPEARQLIPWFRSSYVRPGQSVCKGRWVAIRKGDRVCYGQWEDCGPFRTDSWSYVFGKDQPAPNKNENAGIDVSPAIQAYLDLSGMDLVQWKFVEATEVPASGPWAMHGSNNTFVMLRK